MNAETILWTGEVPALSKAEGSEVVAVVRAGQPIEYLVAGESIGEEMPWDAEVVREMIEREARTFAALLAAADVIAGRPIPSYSPLIERYNAALEALPRRPRGVPT